MRVAEVSFPDQCPQTAQRAMERDADGTRRGADDPRDLSRVHARDAAEQDDLALSRREQGERAVHTREQLPGLRSVIRTVEGGGALARPRFLIPATSPAPVVIDHEATRDREEPREEVSRGLVLSAPSKDADEGLLQQVFREVAITEEADEVGEELRPMALVEDGKRTRVTRAGLHHELVIRDGGHGRPFAAGACPRDAASVRGRPGLKRLQLDLAGPRLIRAISSRSL